MAIDVGRNQLRARSAAHLAASDSLEEEPSAALLLFYGAECGLKAEIIHQRGLRTTADLPDYLRKHDLQRLARELNLPPQLCAQMRPCATRRREAQVSFSELHEAWRYGRPLDEKHEIQAVVVLRALLDWCG
ncbi:hypothetical protein LDL08_01420 [Nonomuraea glycinis]|uniref:Uncharacterized protein n=1 Tax=Nonomuraea glycinis TaxID=2047744 RepID=A0A918A0S1_9ACTN|nr:hypothetical protein [Nonomuraea glycinis]MCA2174837.1 hypothetical protein [Nonomuraea glycinis]GGP01561.1 hypothetical protein GCM10012278_05290 [Nonomuraea glycinis]